MADKPDLRPYIDAALKHPDIQRFINDPSNGADTAFLRERLQAHHDDVFAEAGVFLDEFNSIDQVLLQKRADLAQGLRRPFFITFCYLELAAVLAIISGHWLYEWLGLRWADYPYMLMLSLFQPAGRIIVPTIIYILAAAFGLAIVAWHWWLRPRRRLLLSMNLDIEGSKKRLEVVRLRVNETIDDVVLQYALQIANSVKTDFFQGVLVTPSMPEVGGLQITRPTGLSETTEANRVMPTESRAAIIAMLESLPGASIGISGPRGVGKTTLLNSICATNPPVGGKTAIAIYTSSPVEYDAREFLLHIFSTLCRQVLKTRGLDDETVRRLVDDEEAASRRSKSGVGALRFATVAIFGGLVMTALGYFLAVLIPAFTIGGRSAESIDFKPGPLIVWGIAAACIGAVLLLHELVARTRTATVRRTSFKLGLDLAEQLKDDALSLHAVRTLQNIQFQRSYTTGWSGALKIPIGVEYESTGNISLARNTESLPELVKNFRDFVSRIVAEEEYGRVIIGIDELDKLSSAESVERFLNEIKTVFNIPNCYYLISVSENALSNFERRGIGVRDAFDSAFDDIHRVEYLDRQTAHNLLVRRILNLPGPFLCLCYVISGGLPRDLIRVARTMLNAAPRVTPPGDLASVARALIKAEAVSKLQATLVAVRGMEWNAQVSDLLVGLADQEEEIEFLGKLELKWPQARVEKGGFRGIKATPQTLERFRDELTVYFDFLSLVKDVFSNTRSESEWRNHLATGVFDKLAYARQGFEISSGVAKTRLGFVREDAASSLMRSQQ